MMKLIIQIPCFNEEDTLPTTIRDLPAHIKGIDRIEILIIDDGSTDGTVDVAGRMGANHIIRLNRNTGLAHAFSIGLEESLARGADVIVNTDADNQYRGEGVASLIEPILNGRADIVVGDRNTGSIKHFSRPKKILQKLGSWVVRWASATAVRDATSGFRAITRDAALQLNVFSNYTYTLETLIQAGRKGLVVTSVPVETNEVLRDSRLIRSTSDYVLKSIATILRIFLMYEPLRAFFTLGAMPLIAGLFLLVRFGYFYVQGQGQGHVQSLIVASILVLLAFQTFLLGLLADLIARNRRLQEETRYRIRKMALNRQTARAVRETEPAG